MTGRLLVIGALNVDLVVVTETLPGPGETVVGKDLQTHGGGKGGNSAVAAARSGSDVRYVGAIGDDSFGSDALAKLRADGIDVTDVVVKKDKATGSALIVVDANGENQIAVAAGSNVAITAKDIDQAIKRASGWPGCVLVSTEISAEGVTAAVRGASKNHWPCVLNPAPVIADIRDLLDLSPILTPNQGELSDLYQLLGGSGDPTVADAARALVERTGAPVVVTLGAAGVLVCDAAGATTEIPARSIENVVDTTGAGDTFNGVFAAGLASGQDVINAAQRGVAAASLSVEATGARTSMPQAPAINVALSNEDRATS